MADVTEQEVYSELLKYAGRSETVKVGKTEITVEFKPQDTHVGDSPDALLWLIVESKVFEQNIRVRVPILIEAEKTGIKDAMVDLRHFIERGHFPLEIPMLVVAEKGFGSDHYSGNVAASFELRQLPISHLKSRSLG